MLVKGESVAGIATCIQIPEAKILFDCGVTKGLLESFADYSILFLTHGHLDHTSGILHWIYGRAMRGANTSTIYVNPYLKPKLKSFIQANAFLQDESSPPSLKVETINKEHFVYIKKSENLTYQISAFDTDHTIPSQGYLLESIFKNKEVTTTKKNVLFTGDTRPLNIPEPMIQKLPLLIHECTYFEDVSLDKALKSGHTRLPELLKNIESWVEINPDIKIGLCHFSNRYGSRVQTLLNQALSDKPHLLNKVYIL
jgi:ribonuclease Z